jgi:hypothetical protein
MHCVLAKSSKAAGCYTRVNWSGIPASSRSSCIDVDSGFGHLPCFARIYINRGAPPLSETQCVLWRVAGWFSSCLECHLGWTATRSRSIFDRRHASFVTLVWRRSGSRWRGVNSTNVLDDGLRIGEIGRRMNSKVKLVKIGVYRK